MTIHSALILRVLISWLPECTTDTPQAGTHTLSDDMEDVKVVCADLLDTMLH